MLVPKPRRTAATLARSSHTYGANRRLGLASTGSNWQHLTIFSDEQPKVPFIQRDHGVRHFPAATSDPSFGGSIPQERVDESRTPDIALASPSRTSPGLCPRRAAVKRSAAVNRHQVAADIGHRRLPTHCHVAREFGDEQPKQGLHAAGAISGQRPRGRTRQHHGTRAQR